MNILGKSECTAEQMAEYLISKNANAKSWALKYAKLYLEEGEAEGVRGDGAWIQSCKETGNFKFTGGTAVTFDQNNFCGLGVTSKGMKGHSFDTPRLGIRAQIQHLKGYATSASLKNACIDPRYKYISPKGKAPTFEELAGKWAVPGYDTTKASSLEDAMKKGIGYGFDIVKGIETIKKIKVTTNNNNKEDNKMRIAIHAGHAKDGNKYCGAVGYVYESTEARKVKDLVIKYLKAQGHTVYDCTVDKGTSATNVLSQIVAKSNAVDVDLTVSIHLNASAKKTRDGKTTGTEAYVYNANSKAKDEAQRICNAIAEVGFKNRGVKYSTSLYFLRKTKAPATLLELFFCDDPEDVDLYNANIDKIARKIVKGITGVEPNATTSNTVSQPTVATPSLKATATKKGVQTYLKAYYGNEIKAVLGKELAIDGIFGSNSKKAVAIALQVELNKLGANLKVDGAFGNSSATAFTKYVGALRKGSKGIFVTLWQCLLVGLGYNPNGIDGAAGNGFVNATNLCLKAYGLSADSVVNAADINKIL